VPIFTIDHGSKKETEMQEKNGEPSDIAHPKKLDGLIYGIRLEAGAVLTATDVYDGQNGEWTKCPMAGMVVEKESDIIWVRPTPKSRREGKKSEASVK
jgi:hypothetical protein